MENRTCAPCVGNAESQERQISDSVSRKTLNMSVSLNEFEAVKVSSNFFPASNLLLVFAFSVLKVSAKLKSP